MPDKSDNVLYQLAAPLHQLAQGAQPRWGRMNAQQMVEHLVGAVKWSNGKIKVPLIIPEEKLPIARKQLLSDMPLPHNFQNPFTDDKTYLNTLAEALQKLDAEIADFYTYHAAHPDARPVHPVFGPLSREEWERFHTKHFKHHLEQFGVVS
jgi:oxepin-CoA hydrolase/3-oxo-5,6-dehydrosuberyl-CoA semialdehyde dehydrogenase